VTLWFPTLPGPLVYLEDFVVGHWPEGDEDAMRRAAVHWSDMAEALKGLQDPADQAMNAALSSIDGQVHDAMSTYWNDIGGDNGELKRLIDVCDGFATQLEQGATDIEHTKISIYISVGIMVAMTLWSWIPGAGQAEEAATIVAAKAAIQRVFRKLLSKLGIDAAKFMAKRGAKLVVGAGVGASLGAGSDMAAQGIQLAEGTRKDMDWKSVGLSTVSGAIAGTVAGPAGEKVSEAAAEKFGVTSGAGKKLAAMGGDVVGNLVGNTTASVTTSAVTNQHVDLSGALEGAGGGLGNKHGAHPGPEIAAPVHETTTASETSTPAKPSNTAPAEPTSAPSHTPSAPGEVSTAPASVAPSDASSHVPGDATSPASTATASVAPADASAAPGSAPPAASENPAAPQPDSANSGSSVDTRQPAPDTQPQPAGANSVSAAPDRGLTGQPAAAPGPVPDRSAVPSPGSSSPAPSAAAPSPAVAAPAGPAPTITPRTATDIAPRTDGTTRPDAPTPPASATAAPPRAPEGFRTPAGTDTPPEPGAARSTPGSDAPRPADNTAPVDRASLENSSRNEVPNRTERVDNAAPGARDEVPSRPGIDANQARDVQSPQYEPRQHSPADIRTVTPARDAPPPSSRGSENNAADTRGRPASPASEALNRSPSPSDSGDRVPENSSGAERPPSAPGASDPRPIPDQRPSDLPQQPERTAPTPADQPTHHTTDSPGRDTPPVVAVVTPVHPNGEARGGTPAAAEYRTESPQSTPDDHLGHGGEIQAGGVIRPRDPFDIAAQDKWANDAYEAIRNSDTDVHDMVENLSDSVRSDGSVGFSEQEISQVKQHVFDSDHKLSVFDDNGQVVGYEDRRFDADPDIAEAWMRLSRGKPLPADVALLDHELAESHYLRDHPDASYREAHAFANSRANWENKIPERTGENYEKWGDNSGPVHGVPEGDGNRDRSDLPLREQRDRTGPRTGDPEGRLGRQSGGRYDRPAADEGSRPDPRAEGDRPDLAGRRRDPSLTEPGGQHDGATDLLPADPQRPERDGVPARGDQGEPRSGSGDRQDEQHRPHGPTGGHDVPVGGGRDQALDQTREGVASHWSDRLLTDGPSEPSSPDRSSQGPRSSLDLPPIEPVPAKPLGHDEPTSLEHPVDDGIEHETADTSSTPTDPDLPDNDAHPEHTSEPPQRKSSLTLPEPVLVKPESVRENESHPVTPSTEPQRRTTETQPDRSATGVVDRDLPDDTHRGADHPVSDGTDRGPTVERSTSEVDLDQGRDIGEPEQGRNDPHSTPDSELPQETPPEIDKSYGAQTDPWSSASSEVRDKPYYANSRFHDPDAANDFLRARPRTGDDVAGIRARQINHPEVASLSDAEIAVIRANQFFDGDHGINTGVNSATRDGDPGTLGEYDTAVKALVSAYNKLPDYHGPVVRKISITDPDKLQKFLTDYQPGKIAVDHGCASSDKSASMGGNIELYIDSHYGKDISWASTYQDEVVHPPGNGFRVEGVEHVKGRLPHEDKYIIHVTDVGRNPDEYQQGRDGADSSGGSRADDADRVRRPGEEGSHGSNSGAQQGDGRGGAAGGDRGPEEDLAGLGRVGTAPDRSGTGRDSDVGPTAQQSVAPHHGSIEQTSRPVPADAFPRSTDTVEDGRHSADSPHDTAPQDLTQAPESTPPPAPPRESLVAVARRELDYRAPYDPHAQVTPDHVQQQPHSGQHVPDTHAPRNSERVSEPPRMDPQHAPDARNGDSYVPAPRNPDPRQPSPSTPRYSDPVQAYGRGPSTPPDYQAPRPSEAPRQPVPDNGPRQPPRSEQPPVSAPRRDYPQDLTQAPESTPPPRRPGPTDRPLAQEDPRARQHGQGDQRPVEQRDQSRMSGPDRRGPQQDLRMPRGEGPRRGPSRQEWEAARQARQAREGYRQWRPEGDRVTAVPDRRTSNGKPAFDVRRLPDAHGGPIEVARVKVHMTHDASLHPERVRQLWEKAQQATDLEFNRGQRLLSGDRILVDLVHTPDPAEANVHVHVSESRGTWHPDIHPDVIARQLRDQLGLLPRAPDHPGLGPLDIRQLSNDIAHANTPAPFDNPSELRSNGQQRLQDVERPEYQAAVEDALRDGNRFLVGADPRTNPYGRLINDGGIGVEGRSNNCMDCSLSALSAFHGDPQVSAPRWPDMLPDRTIDNSSGERGGMARAARWLGDDLHQFTDGRPVPDQFAGLHDMIGRMGPGSSALVVNEWHAFDPATGKPLFNADGTPRSGGTHATVIVFPHGAKGPVWWDPQAGTMSPHPPPHMAHGSTRLWYTPTPSHQGGVHGGIPHHGTGGAVPSANLQPRSPVSAVPVRDRMAGPIGPEPGGDRRGSGGGADELGDRLGDRRGDAVPELERDDDRGGLPGSQTGRPGTERSAGIPAPVASEHSAHPGDTEDDRVSRRDSISGESAGGERGIRADDQQEHPAVPAVRPEGGERDRLGGMAERPERQLAGAGDLGGVEHQQGPEWAGANHDTDAGFDAREGVLRSADDGTGGVPQPGPQGSERDRVPVRDDAAGSGQVADHRGADAAVAGPGWRDRGAYGSRDESDLRPVEPGRPVSGEWQDPAAAHSVNDQPQEPGARNDFPDQHGSESQLYRRATIEDLGYRDTLDLPLEERARLERALSVTQMVPPEEVRFTQRSVSRATSDGVSIPDLASSMADGGWRGGPVHAVRWDDGGIASLDNRRLTAARMAGLEHVPTALHAPSDRLEDWPHEWDQARRERNALGVDIRELPDGTLRVGGDQGAIRYARGQVAETWGDIALFRAAEQRSLLPGELGGASDSPVYAAKPAGRIEVDLPIEDGRQIAEAVAAARPQADRILGDLRGALDGVTRELSLSSDDRPAIRGEEYRVKSAESLERKFFTERTAGEAVPDFLERVNDLVRFSVRLPDGERYSEAYGAVVGRLEEQGYEVTNVKNFWHEGNRNFGTNATLRSPDDRLFEVQFPTDASWRANKLTHEYYEVFRRLDEPIERRVHAFLNTLHVNEELRLGDRIPDGMGHVASSKDTSFSKWIEKSPDEWDRYLDWLDENGRDLSWVSSQFGLNVEDLVPEAFRQTDRIANDEVEKGFPEDLPPDADRGPEDPGPEPDGPAPGPGPDGPLPRPVPDSGGAGHAARGDADLHQGDERSAESGAASSAPVVRDRAEVGREVGTALDQSVARQISALEGEAGAKRFVPGIGRDARERLRSDIERLESGRRGLTDLVTRILGRPEFDPVVADAWRSDGKRLAVDIPGEYGFVSQLMFIDRGPGVDPLLVPLRSPEHRIAVIESAARADADPIRLDQELERLVDRPDGAFGRISADSLEHAVQLGTRILHDAPRVQELRDQLLAESSRSAARDVDLVPRRAHDHFAEMGYKPSKETIREYEQKAAIKARGNGEDLRTLIDQLTEPGFDPRVYDVWRQAKSWVTIDIKPEQYVDAYASPQQFRLIDSGAGHEPRLLEVGTREHRLARIEAQLMAGRTPKSILYAHNNEVVDLTAENRDQAIALGQEALREKQIAADMDSMAESGGSRPEVEAIRHRIGSELDQATDRWLGPFRRTGLPKMPAVHVSERDTQSALLRLRSRVTDTIRGGVDPEIHSLWSQDAPAVDAKDTGELVSVRDPQAGDGRRLLPARSAERELALIERELRDGTYPPDIVRKLDALAERLGTAPAVGRDGAEEQGGPVSAEIGVIHREVQSSLRESADRAVHVDRGAFIRNPQPTDLVAHAAPLKHQQMVEDSARDLRERVSNHIGAGIDPEMYRAWQEARDSVPVTIRNGEHVEHMTLLDLGSNRESLLVRSRTPEWELHRIEQMGRTGEDLRAVHRELSSDEREHYLQADSVDEAMSVGRDVLAQRKETRAEITAMQQRSLDAAGRALTSGELSQAEFAQREQQVRSDTKAIGEIADGLFARGIDPKVVHEVRAMYDGKAGGILSHRATSSGPPSVVVTIEREPPGPEAEHNDQTAEHDDSRQRAARDAELSRLRANAEQRKRVLLEQQKQARQREHELAEQQAQAAVRDKKLEETRARERQEAQQRTQARQTELAQIRAGKEKAERELAREREAMASGNAKQPVTRGPEHSLTRGPERGEAHGPEHSPVREPERPMGREFEPPMVRDAGPTLGREVEPVPVREVEHGQAGGGERDRTVVLERQIRELADQEHQLIREHQHDVAGEESRDFAHALDRAQYGPLQLARERELELVREARSTHELELGQTREMLREIGEELSRGREPSHEVRTPVPERELQPVRELPKQSVREPMALEWNSPERQLGQLITLVKQAPYLPESDETIRSVIFM